MENRRNASNVWAYVIAGSAVGGAVGYLFMTQSGKKIRRTVTHPDELAGDVEQAGAFVQRKARLVTDQIHGVIQRAKESIDVGERAYRDAGQQFRTRVRRVEEKNNEITTSVHGAIDRMSRTASELEDNVLEPMIEIGAIYRGVEAGVRSLLGKPVIDTSEREGAIPIQRDQRLMG